MKTDESKPHKGGVVALMLGGPPDRESHDDYEDEDGLDMSAEDAIAAVHDKDPAALKEALKAFVRQCMDAYESEEHDEGDEKY